MITKLKQQISFLLVLVIAMVFHFPIGITSNLDFGLKASAAEITLTEPSTDSNGVYQIGSAAELYWFADKVNNENSTYASANAALTADINLHGIETNQWTPIGTYTGYTDNAPFTGTFDGGGHRITGLYISGTDNYQGLFGYLGSGGTIKSLGVDGSVSGGSNVGGVCGYNKGGTITGCYNTAAVTGTNKYTGGVCGDNSGTISGCYNTGAVTGGSFVGGVCGPNSGTITGCYNSGTVSGTFSDALESGSKTVGGVCSSNSSTITGCYNTGAVTGTNKYTGGVCGSNSGTISGCYNTGAVTGTVSYNSDEAVVGGDDTTRGVGGVCGYNYGSTIESCYNTGAVTGTSDYVGGVCGYNKTYTTIIGNTYTGTTTGCYNIGTVTCSNIFSTNVGGVCGYNGGTTEDCYYLSGCKGTLTTFNSVGTAISVAEFTNRTNFSGWDFSATWKMSDYLERPILSSVPEIKGDGTEMQPYLISDLASLERLRDDVNGGKDYSGVYFALTADIYMSGTYNSTSGKSWTPIGNDKNQFKGIFNGGGHKIIGLYISGTSNYQGLFGYLGEGGMIKSLGVDGSVSGGTDVGGVCGYNGGTITGCYNTAAVTGTGVYVGGVCGRITAGTITGCYNTGTVSGAGNFVGGVGGYNSAGTITGCYNTAAVTGTGVYVGGVCGDNISKIQSCYNTGTVTGSNDVGGVCGRNFGTVTSCYYLSGCNGTDTTFNNVGTAISAADFLVETTFTDWDFTKTWEINAYLERPMLSSVPETTIKGNGAETQPYLISNLTSLEQLHDNVNGGKDYSGVYFALTADIDMSRKYNSTSGKSWTPIGNDTNQFKGVFNGGEHRITGLYINIKSNYQGLFGYLGEGGTIKSLGVDGTVNGSFYVGGVCGYNEGGTITGCYNTGTVSGADVGGVCGVNFNSSTITGCYNIGTVSGAGNFVGGVGGLNGGGTITGCYNTGTVSSTSEYVGGVCGRNNSGKITKCYNTAAVTGSGTNVGGVCGYNYITGATITRCYYDSDKCKVGGITGADTAVKAEGKTSKQFASGEVCYLLNNTTSTGYLVVWGQTIGKESGNDAYPVFHNDTNTVYYGYADCSAADKTYSNSALHETMGHKYDGENHACSYCGNAFAVIEVNYAKLENALTDIYNVDSDGNVGKKADITVDKDTGVVTCLIKVNGDKALIDTYSLNVSSSEGETKPITIEKTKYKKTSGENSINIDMVQLVNELEDGSYTAALTLYDADGNDICIINADFAVSSGTISAG